jgi:hypothetical protein
MLKEYCPYTDIEADCPNEKYKISPFHLADAT